MKIHRSLVVSCAALSAFLGASPLPAACLSGGAVTLYEAGKTPGARIEKTDIPAARGAGASDQSDYKLVVTGSWDVCDTPYPETVEAIRWVGENMYRIRWEASLRASSK